VCLDGATPDADELDSARIDDPLMNKIVCIQHHGMRSMQVAASGAQAMVLARSVI
jgi:hypothetical protein